MKKYFTVLALILMLGTMSSARAQDQQAGPPSDQPLAPSDQPQAPPSNDTDQTMQNQPGVARVSFIHGSVSSQRGDNGDWVAVTLNTPIMAGDRVSTGPDGKGELQLDWADILRLSNNATAKVVTLDHNNMQIQVGQGLVTYSVLKGTEATSEIDTPNASVRPNGEGEYRILVNSNDESVIIVRRGSAEVSTPQGSTHVDQGQTITIQGSDNPQYKIDPAPAPDDWDSWCNDRDRVIARAEQSNHTNQYYVGSQDLDSNGTWTEVPDYGQVWVPRADAGWAPYRDGRWVWEPYYGWTWVSYEPWGWAPYHYGRWFVYGDSWAWWPGPIGIYPGYYPVWSPAYVSFFGWGGGFGFGYGGWGHVGWLPCGPGDWYHPWWGREGGRIGRGGFDRINSLHEGFRPLGRSTWHQYSNVNEAFRNDRIRGGISSMDGHDFGRTAVSARQERISEGTLRNASMSTGRIPVQPSRESYSPSSRRADPASYRNAPPSSQRFFSSRANVNGTSNGLAARGGMNSTSRPTSTARPAQNFGANRSGVQNGSSFQRPSTPTPGSLNTSRGNTSITSSRPGWRTFTPPSSGNANRPVQGMNSSGRAMNNGPMNTPNRGSFAAPSNGNRPAQNQGGWQRFNTPSNQPANRNSGSQGRTLQPSSGSRGYANSSTRPPLNMRQPIVTPRNNGYGSSSRGNYPYSAPRGTYSAPRSYNAPQPSYNAPRPSYNAPRPSYSAPRSYSAPQSAPRSYSAPRSSGGNYHSAPSGGARSSGGGSHPSSSGGSHPSNSGGSHGHH